MFLLFSILKSKYFRKDEIGIRLLKLPLSFKNVLFNLPYARHYNPRFVYFLHTFFHGAFFLKFWSYKVSHVKVYFLKPLLGSAVMIFSTIRTSCMVPRFHHLSFITWTFISARSLLKSDQTFCLRNLPFFMIQDVNCTLPNMFKVKDGKICKIPDFPGKIQTSWEKSGFSKNLALQISIQIEALAIWKKNILLP